MESECTPTFPKPRLLAARRVGRLVRELDEWAEARPVAARCTRVAANDPCPQPLNFVMLKLHVNCLLLKHDLQTHCWRHISELFRHVSTA